MRSPEEGLMGDFVAFWKANGKTRPFYREENKRQIAAGCPNSVWNASAAA